MPAVPADATHVPSPACGGRCPAGRKGGATNPTFDHLVKDIPPLSHCATLLPVRCTEARS
jgi:hypothetical protein